MAKQIGFIGFGLRSKAMLQALKNIEADVEVNVICDPLFKDIKEEWKDDPLFKNTEYCTNTDEFFIRDLDGVFIGTRCPLHTPLATEVLKRNIPLFLEKPVSISEKQHAELKAAGTGKESKVMVSFPLRLTSIVRRMKNIIDSGELGDLTMVQAINNVPYGSVYYHSWYRDSSITGGLFLQKTTHDIDYICYLIGTLPSRVFAHTEKLYFKGDNKEGLYCKDCDKYRTCPESSYVVSKIRKEEIQGEMCCFAKDTGNEDQGSAIFICDNGITINYSQNFVVKKGAARRGCRIIGTKGSAEFDFYTGIIRKDSYEVPETVTYDLSEDKGAHFGGDDRLAENFMRILNGEPSESDLSHGLNSAACCLAAKKSAETGLPVQIVY